VNRTKKRRTDNKERRAEAAVQEGMLRPQTTTNMHVSGRTTVLLQTAQAEVSAPGVGGKTDNIRIYLIVGARKHISTSGLRDR